MLNYFGIKALIFHFGIFLVTFKYRRKQRNEQEKYIIQIRDNRVSLKFCREIEYDDTLSNSHHLKLCFMRLMVQEFFQASCQGRQYKTNMPSSSAECLFRTLQASNYLAAAQTVLCTWVKSTEPIVEGTVPLKMHHVCLAC